jgi:protein-tyrosine phosphatase
MKRIIRLTESDLTRIVKRTISEMRFSDDEEFDSENEFRPYDVCLNMEYLIYNDYATGLITKEFTIKTLNDYKSTASRYLRKKLISSKEYQKISDCYEESMLELENTEYNKLNEMEDENFWDNIEGFDFGEPKDFTEIISDISDLIDNSESTNDFKMKYNQFTKDNRKDLNRLTDDEKSRLHGFINSVITRPDTFN